MPRNSNSTNFFNNGATRIYNAGADHPVPDSVISEVERILSGDNNLDKDLFGLDDRLLKLSCDRPAYSYFEILNSGIIPLDYHEIHLSPRDNSILRAVMLLLLRIIPIISRKKNSQDENDEALKIMGLYFSDRNTGCFAGRPHIEILSDEIWIMSQKRRDDFLKNCVCTLIHELGHALMDPLNYVGGRNTNEKDYRKITHQVKGKVIDFYKLREESLAEMIMYNTIRQAPRSILNKYSNSWLGNRIKNKPYQYTAQLEVHQWESSPDIFGWICAKDSLTISASGALQWMDWFNNQSIAMPIFEKQLGLPWRVK